MKKVIEERYEEVAEMLYDHLEDPCMHHWTAVRELIEEFFGVRESKRECKEWLELILMKYEVNDICSRIDKLLKEYDL